MRIAVGVEYDGRRFHGWQTQDHARNVQDCLERALGRIADQHVSLVCAGRTDAGVHATAQVAHFDTTARRESHAWLLGANRYLPPDASLSWALPVRDDFHARFSARARHYRYCILNRPTRPAVLAGLVTWHRRPLDVDLMREAARHLVGQHDFSAFRAAGCQARSPVRTLHRLEAWRSGDRVYIDVEANAFLHHMVRNLAGVLLRIGEGVAAPVWAGEVLASRDRRAGGVTAPPDGLYLTGVRYPDEFHIPTAQRPPDFG